MDVMHTWARFTLGGAGVDDGPVVVSCALLAPGQWNLILGIKYLVMFSMVWIDENDLNMMLQIILGVYEVRYVT